MSRSKQIEDQALDSELYSLEVSTPFLLPLVMRRALGDVFYDTDPSQVPKSSQREYLLNIKQAVVAGGAEKEWTAWNRLPHPPKPGEETKTRRHSQPTLMAVFSKLYKQEQALHGSREESLGEQAQQESHTTAVRDEDELSQAASLMLSEEGEVPPVTPVQDTTAEQMVSEPKPAPSFVSPASVSVASVERMIQRVATAGSEQQARRVASPTSNPEQVPVNYLEMLDLITRRTAQHLKRK